MVYKTKKAKDLLEIAEEFENRDLVVALGNLKLSLSEYHGREIHLRDVLGGWVTLLMDHMKDNGIRDIGGLRKSPQVYKTVLEIIYDCRYRLELKV